ncbi:MAG: YncE family protein [Gemmatimonadota bacterium]|nr:YncE family protein [Gemmatimonadota bacterium]
MRPENPIRCRALGLLTATTWLLAAPAATSAQDAGASGARSYYVYVAAESEDRVDIVRFRGGSATLVDSISVGRFPTEIDGPHGLAVDPSGERWYLTLAHGNPFGSVVGYSTETNRPEGSVTLGMFPATMQVTPAGLLFAVNFNLHGDHVPSSVSVVDVQSMIEIAQVETCTMPHGSRLTRDGARHYSACMMDDMLVEIDALRLEVSRRMYLGPENERDWPADDSSSPKSAHEGMDMPVCSPTWAQPSIDGSRIYVACNKNAEVLEIDSKEWRVTRRFETGPGPYNLDVTPDGRRLVVTYKGGQATGVWDLETGREHARIANSRRLPHGIAVTPDSRFAFITVEGVGGEPGTVDVIDLERGELVSSADVGKQAGGVAFWKVEGS